MSDIRNASPEVGFFPSLRRTFALAMAGFVETLEPVLRGFGSSRRRVAVEDAAGDLTLHEGRAGKLAPVAAEAVPVTRARSRRRDAELRLAPDHVLTTHFTVPPAATGFLNEIVQHRLDKLTPWNRDAIFYGYAVADEPLANGDRRIDFAATSKTIAGAAIARLEALGLTPSRMGSAEEPLDAPLRIDLFRSANDRAKARRRAWIRNSALATLLFSAIAFGTATYLNRVQIEELAQAVETVSTVRERLMSGTGGDAEMQADLALIEIKRPETAMIALVDGIAETLPDNTVLEALEVSPTAIRISGASEDATALIGLLEARPEFSRVTFGAPVTRQDDGRDRFDITADFAAES